MDDLCTDRGHSLLAVTLRSSDLVSERWGFVYIGKLHHWLDVLSNYSSLLATVKTQWLDSSSLLFTRLYPLLIRPHVHEYSCRPYVLPLYFVLSSLTGPLISQTAQRPPSTVHQRSLESLVCHQELIPTFHPSLFWIWVTECKKSEIWLQFSTTVFLQ